MPGTWIISLSGSIWFSQFPIALAQPFWLVRCGQVCANSMMSWNCHLLCVELQEGYFIKTVILSPFSAEFLEPSKRRYVSWAMFRPCEAFHGPTTLDFDVVLQRSMPAFFVSFIAGGAYGLTSVAVGQPFDTVKTRMQARPDSVFSSSWRVTS